MGGIGEGGPAIHCLLWQPDGMEKFTELLLLLIYRIKHSCGFCIYGDLSLHPWLGTGTISTNSAHHGAGVLGQGEVTDHRPGV